MKMWKIDIEAQRFECADYDTVRARMRTLLDAGLWYVTLSTFETPPPPKADPEPVKAREPRER